MVYRILILTLLCVATALGQVDRATVTGTLLDPTGAVIVGGQVSVRYPATGLERQVTSNGAGAFLLAALPVGHVVINAEAPGFRPIQLEADLNVGETKTFDLSFDLANTDTSVQVVAEADLTRNSAALGVAFRNEQISQLPINGRNFGNLAALVPGAVDSGGSQVTFLAHGKDDVNMRIDGVDATSVRNQTQKSRLLLSTEAISEFRVNTTMYTAEDGGANGGQVEVVTKSGGNQYHGNMFEYLRNSAVDSRSPFDGKTVPPFRLNQFGGTLGGPIVSGRTFFFASYEGLVQRQGMTQIGFVPSAAFRKTVDPALQSILNIYPNGQTPINANVDQWRGVGSNTHDEHVGMIRVDHRFTDRLSSYFRFSRNNTNTFSPNKSLPVGTQTNDTPTNGLFELMYLISPTTTNELRIGVNRAKPLNKVSQSGIDIAVSIPSFSKIPASSYRIAYGTSESIIDQWTSQRGSHTLKAGVEIKPIQLVIHDSANAQAGTLTFASLADFQANNLTTLEYSAELPTKQMRKTTYFGYFQDEWKIRPNLTANLGLRYEYYNVFHEIHNRAIPFDMQTCGGYCPAGSAFGFPDKNNFAPRIGFAWTPNALHGRTVIRFGGGIYYGDAQLGDAYNPANNDAVRFTLSSATTPGLSFPIGNYLAAAGSSVTAPRSMPRNKRNQDSQQWTFSIQHAITNNINFQVSYAGQQNYHVFSRTYVNVIDPVTGQRPLPNLNQIDVRGANGVSSYHGLISTLQINNLKGLLLRVNYTWSHGINDNSSGGGGSDGAPQNVNCRSCDKGNSSLDVRHVFTLNYAYQIPWARSHWYGGWDWSGIATARTGQPVNITVSRKASDMPDGNTLSHERPNLVPGVPLYLNYGTAGLWLNPAAFAVPAPGTWGNLGRNVLRAPGMFQIDTALTKDIHLTETTTLKLGAQIFNILNHPQLGAPKSNISSASFGRITTPINTSPVGSGTPRQVQFLMRLSF